MCIQKLPDEILQKIFSYLSVEDRRSCAPVCKRWSRAMRIPQFFTTIFYDWANKLRPKDIKVLERSYRPYTKFKVDTENVNLASVDPLLSTLLEKIPNITEISIKLNRDGKVLA